MTENTNPNTFAGNIDLFATRKKRFTIDGSEDRVLELDTSDLSILSRLTDTYPKLTKLAEDILSKTQTITTDSTEEETHDVLESLNELDREMRKFIDYIFDSNVCEVCAPSGLMIDPVNGQLKFEYLLENLFKVYQENLSSEYKKIKTKMKSHTDKYTKK